MQSVENLNPRVFPLCKPIYLKYGPIRCKDRIRPFQAGLVATLISIHRSHLASDAGVILTGGTGNRVKISLTASSATASRLFLTSSVTLPTIVPSQTSLFVRVSTMSIFSVPSVY